jgi:hypothetical protein
VSFFHQFFRFITTPVRWLLSLPMWVISSPRRVWGLSLPARAAVLVFLVLLICTLGAVAAILWTKEAADIRNYFYNATFPVVVGLVFIIPIVVYYWLKLWLEGDVSRFPDIDAAWKEGMAALAENGFDLASFPVFLVIGAPDERLTKSVFKATAFDFVVRDVPAGLAPLRFYADDKAIYVACIDTGRLGKLQHMARAGGGAKPQGGDVRGTMEPSGGVRGTMIAGGGDVRGTALATSSVGGDGGGDYESQMIRGTLVPGGGGGGGSARGGGSSGAPSGQGSSLLSRRESDLETERLHYICELIRRARRPVCPINGVLVLLPLDVVQQVIVAKDIPATIKSDLDTIRHATQLRCPVTIMVTGMEQEGGFGELVRRVGTSKAKANRFGKGFDVWNPPTEENIDAFSSHACGAFEDWVYNLFRERDGLTKPGNAKLYMLLCKIRSEVRARLRGILLHGISIDATNKEAELPPLFNGCYFAATGESEDRQAFVRNVFEKMIDQEEELEWIPEAWREDSRHHALAQLGMAIDGALILGVIAMFVVKYWWK